MSAGTLEKLKIVAYKGNKFKTKAGSEYTLMLNPENMDWNGDIKLSTDKAQNRSLPNKKYIGSSQSWSFDTIIDCTGVVDKNRLDMSKEVKDLQKTVFEYNGNTHKSNSVIISWGSKLSLKGKLTKLNIKYTLFKPNGTPLRAKVSMTFESSTDPSKAANQEDKKSPDMTHLIVTKEGDSLPQLSESVYEKSSCYIQIAKHNKLNKFRRLPANTNLSLPPLVKGVS